MDNIKVVCRIRPFLQNESNQSNLTVLDEKSLKVASNEKFNNNNNSNCEEQQKNIFNFDRVFNQTDSQEDLYTYSAKHVVDQVLQGFNGTILAYGQTGSGKTYTMIGDSENEGIMPRMIQTVFQYIENSIGLEFQLKISFFEIYMENLIDLIKPENKLKIRQNQYQGIFIEGIEKPFISNQQELKKYIKIATSNRKTNATNMNDQSSRSHFITNLEIIQTEASGLIKKGKLFIIDLAGSEKVSRTLVEGKTLEEAKKINLSLSQLGNVINSLTNSSSHIPYRESLLTRILQESLGGNAKTTLVVTVSPSNNNHSETLSTLRFGIRAKRIQNKPQVNQEFSNSQLKEQISKLQKKIQSLEEYIKQNFSEDQNLSNIYQKSQSSDFLDDINVDAYLNGQAQMKEMKDQFELQINELEIEQNLNRDKIFALKDQIERMKIENQCLQDQNILYKEELSFIQFKQIKEQNESLRQLNQQQRHQNLELQEKISNLEKYSTDLQRNFQLQEEKIRTYTENLDVDSLFRLAIENQINKLELEKNNFLRKLKNKVERNNQLFQELELEKERLSMLNNDNEIYEQNEQYKLKIVQQDQTIKQLHNMQHELLTKTNIYKLELSSLGRQLTSKNQQIKILDVQLSQIKEEQFINNQKLYNNKTFVDDNLIKATNTLTSKIVKCVSNSQYK